VLSATSSNFLFAANESGPSRIVEINLEPSMRPFDGHAQAPGLGLKRAGTLIELAGSGRQALDYRAFT